MVEKRILPVFLMFFLTPASFLFAGENLQVENLKGRWDVGLVTSAGTGVYGSEKDTELWLAGFRLGNILSRSGHVEYVIEIDPAFIIFQDTTVYGFGVTPALFRWTLRPESRVSAFFEFGAGMLITSSDVPEGVSQLNFTPQGALGIRWKKRNHQTMSLGLQYVHISNGGLERPNPGINTLLIQFVYSWLR